MGLELLYRLKGESIEILRCFGERGVIALPETIEGRPVTALGDYLFSAEMRTEPEGLLWEADSCPERGENDGGLPKYRDIFAGGCVEEVFLPASLKRIGRYAFYNCGGLRTLHLTSAATDIGAGAFNGCRKITDLYIDVVRGEKSCLKEILADLNETLTVHYRETERDTCGNLQKTGEAELLFPVFYEEAVENTPAKMLETHVHGCGHRYRYCFQGTEFEFREYDSLFSYAEAWEELAGTVKMAVGRLRFPLYLSKKAKNRYREYLLSHMEDTADYLAGRDDMGLWKWFTKEFSPEWAKVEHASADCLGNECLAVRAREENLNIEESVLGKTDFDKLIEASSRLCHTEASGFLMDAAHRAYPVKKKKFKL